VLILVKEGTLYIAQQDVHYEVNPNQYIFLNAGEEHFGFAPSSGKLSYSWVHFFPPEEATDISEEKWLLRPKQEGKEALVTENNIYFVPEKGEISDASNVPLQFYQLLNLSHKKQYTDCIADYTLSLLVMEITQEFYDRHNKQEQSIPPYVVKIMDWIRANYDQHLTVASIAREFDYNPDYLSALFSKTANISLIHFINKTRIDISKSLIVNYDISISEAAYSCGFSDEKYFMKTFKKLENLTPTQYRKAFFKKR
jgi:YesN/AraC family two-component response regulator